MKLQPRLFLIPVGVVGFCYFFLQLERRPGTFANSQYLGAILALELVTACLLRFEKVFFPVTMICFLAADTANPFAGESFTLRWLFLAVGALAGPVIWMKDNRERHFGTFHLIALFCALDAVASASASAATGTGLLKAGSLFLLFLYAATGGRVALAGREQAFVRGLVLACEILVFVVSAAYFAGLNAFGNPNNLGAFVGVIAFPVLLWAALVAESKAQVQRRYTALALCAVLLYVSVCRAAIVADAAITIGLTLGLRRPGLLIKAAFAGALLLEIMAVANPAHMSELAGSLTGKFLYKEGQTHSGVLGSRQGPWDETISAVKQHPWFGTGFGTSDLGNERPDVAGSSIYTVEGSNREHGSSYMAMAEYMGMLGILPFIVLLILVV